jgi:hypothetical protein
VAQSYYSIKKADGPASLDSETINKLDWFIDHNDGWVKLSSAILSLKD